MRINGSTSNTDYKYIAAYRTTGDWYGIDRYNEDAGYFRLPTDASTYTGDLFTHIFGCNGAGYKPFYFISFGNTSGSGTAPETLHGNGAYINSSVVTSVSVTSSTGNFDGGTLYVYGA